MRGAVTYHSIDGQIILVQIVVDLLQSPEKFIAPIFTDKYESSRNGFDMKVSF